MSKRRFTVLISPAKTKIKDLFFVKNKWHQKKNSEIKKGGAGRASVEGDHRKLAAQSHVWHTGSGCVGEEDWENLIYKIDDLAKLYRYYNYFF